MYLNAAEQVSSLKFRLLGEIPTATCYELTCDRVVISFQDRLLIAEADAMVCYDGDQDYTEFRHSIELRPALLHYDFCEKSVHFNQSCVCATPRNMNEFIVEINGGEVSIDHDEDLSGDRTLTISSILIIDGLSKYRISFPRYGFIEVVKSIIGG